MADRPIQFSAPMVRALLDGRKSQTRRAINPQPAADFIEATIGAEGLTFRPAALFGSDTHAALRRLYRPGDRLWVREAWRTFDGAGMDDDRAPRDLPTQIVWYGADGPTPTEIFAGRLRAGMHMPRWASRLTLIVTEVRVQRLQEISEDDAKAEGPGFVGKITGEVCESSASHRLGIGPRWRNARDWYADLWDGLNADRGYGWDTNPWVVAVSFETVKANIDSLPAEAA
jgi:hypothetical protein